MAEARKKVVLVTGAGDGIGRGIARAFAREGYAVAICDLDAGALEGTADLIRVHGTPLHDEAFDVRDGGAIRAFVDRAAERLGGLHVLITNAAVMPYGPMEGMDVATVDTILSVNLRAPILFSKHAIPHIRSSGGGSIIHMASATGHLGHAGVAVYGATKAALISLARGQAVELAPAKIRVNSVSPGTIDSPMLHRFVAEHASDPQAALRNFDKIHPRGRIGTIEEVAAVFLFLASDAAANITGADIRCDGGYTAQGQMPRD